MAKEGQDQHLSGSLQENALTLLCFSDKYHSLVRSSVPVELFSTFLYRDVVARVHVYIDQFKKPPKAHLPDLVEDVLAEGDERSKNLALLLRSLKDLSGQLNEEWAVSQLHKFVRQQRLKLGMIEAYESMEQGDLDKAELLLAEAAKARAKLFDKGYTLDDIYKDLLLGEDVNERVATGIKELDQFDYGPTRKELMAVLAAFGRGKTWFLIWLAKQALIQRWRVLYITLEVDARIIGRRTMQTMWSMTKRERDAVALPMFEEEDGRLVGVTGDTPSTKWASIANAKDVKALGKKLAQFRQKGNLIVKQFPTSQLTFNGLAAYLDSLDTFEHFVPDMLVVDYPKLMNLGDIKNLRLELGSVFEKLRGLAVERNMAVVVAHQVNREGTQAKTGSEAHVAEDISLIGTSDQVIFYNQTETEKDLKLARLYVAKGRNDVSRFTVLISQEYAIGQFVVDSRALTYDYWMVLEKENQARQGAAIDAKDGDS